MLSTGSDIKSSLGEPLFLFYDFGYFLVFLISWGYYYYSHFSPCWQVDAHSNLGNLMKAQGLVQEVSQCLISAIFVMHVRCAIIIIEVCGRGHSGVHCE